MLNNSDGHIKLEYFATAKLFLDPLAHVADRDIIAKQMTPSQIAEAQKLARECVAKDYKGC